MVKPQPGNQLRSTFLMIVACKLIRAIACSLKKRFSIGIGEGSAEMVLEIEMLCRYRSQPPLVDDG
jgi:hypothetical protein